MTNPNYLFKQQLSVLLLLQLWIGVLSDGICPAVINPYCTCTNGTVSVVCIGNNITKIPTEATNANLLKIFKGYIDIIDAVPHENLSALILENNHIRYIKDNAFQKLTKLKFLYLKNNDITGLNNRTLWGLKSLLTVTLQLNPLYVLKSGVFSHRNTPKITEIRMEESKLYHIESRAFSQLVHLTYLNLSYNHLRKLPVFNKLDDLNSLHIIDLSRNYIETISGFGLRHLPHLQELFLHGNQIKIITRFDMQGIENSLVQLDLSSNGIEKVGASAFISAVNLSELNLENNHITYLYWEEMPPISKLNLANNPWDCTCNNSYMVEDINKGIRVYNYNQNTLCATPASVAGKPIFQVPIETFKCPNPHHHTVKTSLVISLGVILSLLFMVGGAVFCQIMSRKRRHNEYKQPYTKVTANGGIHM